MDFVFVEDVARANVLAAVAPVTDEVFNVGSGVETSLLGLSGMLLATMGSKLFPEHREERKVNAVTRRLASTLAAEERLGFKAIVGLEEGLARLVSWYESRVGEGPPDRAGRPS
jgi:UDP-glucose 4-epimerase